MQAKSFARRTASAVLLAAVLVTGSAVTGGHQAMAATMTVYKSPWCGCCKKWVEHMRRNGFDVEVVEREDVTPVKRMLGIPPQLASCHTAGIGGYVIEGHVPAADVKRLLSEKPEARGLAVPGMPVGSPGMEQGGARDSYHVILFGGDRPEIYASY